MSKNNIEPRCLSKKSVNRAIELLNKRNNLNNCKKRTRSNCDQEKELEKKSKIKSFCTSTPYANKRNMSLTGFSKSLALSEMRSYLMNHDWRHLLALFPYLLSFQNEVEPLIWRYALTAVLYSSTNNFHLKQFLQQCVGYTTDEDCHVLERLLLLQTKKSIRN